MARPREFDANVALDRALDEFWSKGYETTSVDDLCRVTGLSRSSLYTAFGGKRDILLKAVDRYVDRRAPSIAAELARPVPIREAVSAFLDGIIEQIVSGSGRRGCFLGNCAAELPRADRGAMARVRAGLERMEATFGEALAAARSRGELPEDTDIEVLARFLTASVQGLRLVGKANPDRAILEDVALTILKCLEPPFETEDSRKPARKGNPDNDAEAPTGRARA